LVSLYREAKGQLSGNLADYFDSLQEVANFHRTLVLAFLQRTALRFGGCKNLVLKEPALTTFFPQLGELLPEAVFLLIIRDPRDTIASMVRVGQKQKATGQQYIFASRDIPQLCQHYRSFYAPIFASTNKQFRDRVMIIRYEDLVQRPQETIDSLRVLTGLTFDGFDPTTKPDPGQIDEGQLKGHPVYQPWTTDLYYGPISGAQVGRFASILADDEIRQIETSCKGFMDSFNYSPHNPTAAGEERRTKPPAPHSAKREPANTNAAPAPPLPPGTGHVDAASHANNPRLS
jgi:hypothetical protein